jgi:hypothetical protein
VFLNRHAFWLGEPECAGPDTTAAPTRSPSSITNLSSIMKKILCITLLGLLVSALANAQDSAKTIRELGINFSNLNSFGIRYKTGKGNAFLRLTGASLAYSKNTITDTTGANTGSFNFFFSIGMEKRKKLNEKLVLYYGADLLTGYSFTSYHHFPDNVISDQGTLRAGIGIVGGMYFKISEALFMSVEVVPSLYYDRTSSKEGSGPGIRNAVINSYSLLLSNTNASLTLAYRF